MKKSTTVRKLTVAVLAIISILLIIPCSRAQTQNGKRKITGSVRARITDEVVGSATIAVKGSSEKVQSDLAGNFSIMAATGDVLEVSSIGYAKREFKVGTASSIELRLDLDYNNLEEATVVGYGKMKKTDLSSSQVTVSSEAINRTVNTSIDQALQGRAANVYVTNGSGQPGAGTSVVIRGLGSLTNTTQPLYVIDGVQYQPGNPSDDPYNHPQGFANMLSAINPDDVESMNVLQGPSATAIYGTAGSNGVILITTKKGKAGDSKITVNTLWTVQDLPKRIPVMDLQQYAVYRNAFANAGGAAPDPNFADPSILGKGTDWQSALFRKTLLQKHSLALSGGTDRTTFYFSGEYFNQDGIAPGSGFSRYNVHLNLENQTRRWLKIGMNVNASQSREVVNITNAGIIQLAIQQNPSIPVKNPDGSYGGPSVTQYAFTNPVALAQIDNDYNKYTNVLGGIYANVQLMKGLVWYNDFNGNMSYNNNYQFHPSYQFGNYINATTTATRTAGNNYWMAFNTRLQYDTKIGKHSISAMIGHEAQQYGYEGLSGGRQNYVTNDIQELTGGDATSATNSSSKGDGSKESYLGRLYYIYNNRYIVQFTDRYDGASTFGPGRRWGNFPAVSAAWRISQEDFMKSVTAIDELKLRVEYGSVGNANGGGYYAVLQAVPTGWGTGFLAGNFPNRDLHWETDKTANIGFDLHMFHNRLEVIADAYIKNISELNTKNPYAFYNGGDISYSPGYISWPNTNVGSMRNTGFGITVNTVNLTTKELTWRSGVNFSIDRNKITQLITPINYAYFGSQAEFVSEVGKPASMMTGYIAEGLFQNYKDIQTHAKEASSGIISPSQGTWVGDIKFKDLNNDGVIDQNDRTIIGNPWPKFTFGFNNSFTYKNFDLNIFIQGSVGNDIMDFTRYQNESPLGTGPYSNYYASVANFARPSSINISDSTTAYLVNSKTTIPRIAPGDPNGNNRFSQWFIEDGSYVRVKNVSLAYTFPQRWISKASIRGLRVAVNVQNLLTITNYKGYDPEIGMVNYGGTIMSGVDNGRYPNVRMYSFNLTADF